MLPDIINPSFTRFLALISEYAFKANVDLVFCNTEGNPDIERSFLERMLSRDISGILYVFTPACIDYLHKSYAGIPVLEVGDSSQTGCDANIASDNYEAARILAEHIYSYGHRHIAYITLPVNAVSVLRQRRLQGLLDYFTEKGMADTFHVYEQTAVVPPSFVNASGVIIGREKCQRILQDHPEVTAILTMGDMVAIGVYEALKAAGKRIPEDFSVASFDNIEFAQYVTPSLTTMDLMLNMRCRLAFDYLMQMITEGKNGGTDSLFVAYRSSLNNRDSTGPVRTW